MSKSVIDKIVETGLLVNRSVIIVGLSGGPDSLCLLDALVQLSDIYELDIVPVHINHKLRAAAEEEAMSAVRMCERLDLECQIFEADCKAMADDLKMSTEEAGRYIRYEIFDDVAKEIEASGVPSDKIFIAVAHNADDQSETVLFRLLRGTGVKGLSGMPQIRSSEEGYMIIRPLLGVERSEIEAYIEANRLKPNIDESNASLDYARNRIRNELIPYLEKNYNPNIKQALRRFAEIADVDDSFLQDLAYGICSESLAADDEKSALILDVSELSEVPPAVTSRVINIILQSLRLDSQCGYDLIVALLGLIYSDNPSASVDLPAGYKAFREYDNLIFSNDPELFIDAVNDKLRLVPQVMMAKEYKPLPGEIYAAFDFDKFNKAYPGRVGEIKLRTRQEGDFIAIKGGSKKIQDLFVDIKVRKNARESFLMACMDNEVLWILPNDNFPSEKQKGKGRFSHNFQIDERTERVLFLEVVETIW